MTHGGNLSPEFLRGCEDNGGLTQSGPAKLESTLDSITFFFSPPHFVKACKNEKKKKEISENGRGCDFFSACVGVDEKHSSMSLRRPWWVHIKRSL